jgi:hypothetical protein
LTGDVHVPELQVTDPFVAVIVKGSVTCANVAVTVTAELPIVTWHDDAVVVQPVTTVPPVTVQLLNE